MQESESPGQADTLSRFEPRAHPSDQTAEVSGKPQIRPAPVSATCQAERGRIGIESAVWDVGLDGAPGCLVVPERTSRKQVVVERERSDISRFTLQVPTQTGENAWSGLYKVTTSNQECRCLAQEVYVGLWTNIVAQFAACVVGPIRLVCEQTSVGYRMYAQLCHHDQCFPVCY